MEEIKPHLTTILSFLIESEPEETLPNVEGIFVLGHIDPRLARHAAHLWKLGKAPRIILAGKGRRDLPAGFESEADYYATIIQQDGVPSEHLLLEERSTNSLENVLFGIEACRAIGWDPKTLIVCSVPPLLRRSCATFRWQFPEITVWGSAFPTSVEEWLEPKRAQRVLAEFERFEEYTRQGDIAPVEIPFKVQEAIREIKSRL